MRGLARYLSLVKFSHSIFALPFALQGAWLAAGGRPDWSDLAWILLCMVSARTAAMGFNRLVDRELDERNPRTSARELPAGEVSVPGVRVMVGLSALLFIAAAFQLNRVSGFAALPVLAVLCGYSYVKRFSFGAHAVLGLALGIAPLAAWVAIRGELGSAALPAYLLAVGVWAWVTGFDLIYACQDAEHDRAAGLHSVPARFGVRRALGASKLLHLAAGACFVAVAWTAGTGGVYAGAVALALVLLAWQHRLVRADDLRRVDMAFFTMNGWVGVALFLGLVLDMGLHGGGA